ncbi:hypothetical protein L596_017459 [Steinernema carpocapsae]|uniref:Autophagy-related protein 101 n=1 Tax=Steinernema carpocapsae TaxID=34508 RepID=A0A4U5N213_STECR|nr:hypothetical protein L596_017459 [Steinernema carpocapsae]
MNARTQHYQLTVELRQVKESVLCFMHTLLLHRSLGKFTYTLDNSYTLGSIGVTEVPCESIDVTYVRVNSPELKQQLEDQVNQFINDVTIAARGIANAECAKINDGIFTHGTDVLSANVKIEFFTKKKKSQWRFLSTGDECAVWEIWELQLDIVKVQSTDGVALLREKVSDDLSTIVLSICSLINKGQYIPKMPNNADYPSVFDGSITDCQPYHYRILWPGLAAQLQASHGDSSSNLLQNGFMKKILKDTLSF